MGAYNRRVPDQFAAIDSSTRYCAVFGHPIGHSASPAMHNAALAQLALNWKYLAFDVHPDHLAEAIAGARRMKFIGLNLTVPHKLLALKMVDSLDDSAQVWGAVNTICFEAKGANGEWLQLANFTELPEEIRSRGFNTDADAIIRSIQEDLGLKLAGAQVLLLGAGGAGRVAALKLASENISGLYLVNRTASKAESLAAEITKRFSPVKVTVGYPKESVDLLLNATSLGLKSDDAFPVDRSKFDVRSARAVYDMIYRPAETPLLKAAREAGCRSANGIGMLLYQGARALEIWTGRAAPLELMRSALVKNIYGS
ncbi:MAG TPA: shikimate dehydrogenase [Verrucomicrobiae bacterium]|nr:shikimate dehydrogenase [Verrucomicrobiae bacterium]